MEHGGFYLRDGFVETVGYLLVSDGRLDGVGRHQVRAPYHEGFSTITLLCRWFRLVCYNLPFAYFSQMFFIQPFVRFAIRRIFPSNIARRNERNASKTVKPTDEAEAIADVFIREKEIAAAE